MRVMTERARPRFSRATKRKFTSIGLLLVVFFVWAFYLFPVVWLLMM